MLKRILYEFRWWYWFLFTEKDLWAWRDPEPDFNGTYPKRDRGYKA